MSVSLITNSVKMEPKIDKGFFCDELLFDNISVPKIKQIT